jgi:hypothetical protein
VPIHYAWMRETEVGYKTSERLKLSVNDECELGRIE